MKNKLFKAVFLGLALSTYSIPVQAQSVPNNQKMEWFKDAKLGIFIHWGIYSVNGISESWSFFNNYINHENYMKQLNGFSASKYHPEQWVDLIKESGAKYAVITTKHHDGVALWDSKAQNAITVPNNTLAKKDVLSPFVSTLKNSGLKTGLYFSLPDWSHPYYDVNTRTKKRYEIKNDQKRWQNFVNYYQTQLTELSSQYHPDLLWFDGDWEHTSDEWQAPKTLSLLKKYNSNIIINSRLNTHGDYETPEQGVPVISPTTPFWELCYTMNDSWGYQPYDLNYKTPNMIVRTLADVISMGGNLLLDIDPTSDGSIPEKQVEILKNLGRWTSKNTKAIYETDHGIPFENYKGKSALSKDKKSLFLYLEEAKSLTKIYGLEQKPKSVKILGDNQAVITMDYNQDKTLTLNFSNVKFDKDVTVAELIFETPPTLVKNLKKEEYSLTGLLENKSSQLAAYDIANALHYGNNIMTNSGLTSDGLTMTIKKTAKTNPETINWISKHAEALFETEKGLPDGHYSGMSALSKDKQTLYLFVEGTPTGPVALKGIKNEIARIRIVGEGTLLDHKIYNKLYWSERPGIIYIDIPKDRLDKNMTVIAVLLNKPIELYREKVGAIENNL
ncbi:alpha-L-fucosidase [Chryseobacterium lactis]|uniref:alpha-L-fucosidase n=1 Tax=Chryseobacterium lactis TaxID=1241981 RepID=A0A3G6RF79_CHRLC|nr:alpha-L-fucosidase [Chryseobacterium lactis]AZA83316.1 alpha-L-fucosidase [Chryseobacterium lactis]AZB03701.1 alpha-L-fucosidase [Chryseobacterium lactis]PNW11723.1 alpha-L-fucosidase [Chryseobacterium lactis]